LSLLLTVSSKVSIADSVLGGSLFPIEFFPDCESESITALVNADCNIIGKCSPDGLSFSFKSGSIVSRYSIPSKADLLCPTVYFSFKSGSIMSRCPKRIYYVPLLRRKSADLLCPAAA
uniref:ZP domain-containing protein n=1 Tax=Rodentolepis nana TaxID=102285 RepID=A0A0R3THZ3_RODNA